MFFMRIFGIQKDTSDVGFKQVLQDASRTQVLEAKTRDGF